jgi:hypothetical protein
MILHYGYELVPVAALRWVAAVDESFFQHAKIAFFSYLAVNLVEYAWRGRRLVDKEAFTYARLLTTTLLPWFVFIIWFTGPAYVGPIPNLAAEILFANVALLVAGLATLIVEERLEGLSYDRPLKAVIVGLFIISASLYVIFTFRMPWHDVFADPLAGALRPGGKGVRGQQG